MVLKSKYMIFGLLSIVILWCILNKGKENFQVNSKKGRPFTYVGLFHDASSRDLPKVAGSVNEATPLADAAKCQVMCKDYKYFGLQYFGECWCGNTYGKYYEKTKYGVKAKFNPSTISQQVKQLVGYKEKKIERKKFENEVLVLSDDHTSGITGQYFNFDIDTFNKAFKRTLPRSSAGARADVWRGNKKIHNYIQLQLWNFPNGGSKGNGHGRLRYNDGPGQWKAGDIIIPSQHLQKKKTKEDIKHDNKYSGGYAAHHKHSKFEDAKDHCLRVSGCGAVTKEGPVGKYTLRKGIILHKSPSNETSWLKKDLKNLDKQNSGKVEEKRGHIYSHFKKGCVNGKNIKRYKNKTVEECGKLCDDYGSGCKGFEYGVAYGGRKSNYKPGDCQLQSGSNTRGCSGSSYNLDFYKKGELAPASASNEEVKVVSVSNNLNWIDQYNNALKLGGRLPLHQEIMDNESVLKKQGVDRWVAGIIDINGGTKSSNRDWYQIGNQYHSYGKSHRNYSRYPSWGDVKKAYSFRGNMVVVAEVVENIPIYENKMVDKRQYGVFQNYVFKNHSYMKNAQSLKWKDCSIYNGNCTLPGNDPKEYVIRFGKDKKWTSWQARTKTDKCSPYGRPGVEDPLSKSNETNSAICQYRKV